MIGGSPQYGRLNPPALLPGPGVTLIEGDLIFEEKMFFYLDDPIHSDSYFYFDCIASLLN
jgi:hypothetical protein